MSFFLTAVTMLLLQHPGQARMDMCLIQSVPTKSLSICNIFKDENLCLNSIELMELQTNKISNYN